MPEIGDSFNGAHILIGMRESAKAIRQKRAKRVFFAEDAAASVIAPLVDECRIRGIAMEFVDSKDCLGEMAGIDRAASVVCVLNDDLPLEDNAFC